MIATDLALVCYPYADIGGGGFWCTHSRWCVGHSTTEGAPAATKDMYLDEAGNVIPGKYTRWPGHWCSGYCCRTVRCA